MSLVNAQKSINYLLLLEDGGVQVKTKEPFGFLTFKKLKISNPFRFRFEGRIEEQILLGTVESTVREQWISI